ncbi:MAG: fibronectin type III domain-containing protein [Patescibacteria group bacterium]
MFAFFFASNVLAATGGASQNIGVTVDNGGVIVPPTPTIIRSENITTNTLDLVVEVGGAYASETIDFVVTITNTFTGDVTSVSQTKITDSSAQAVLDMTGLDPGTEYDFTVRYRRPSDAYSGDSDPHTAVTAIDSPVLNSVDDITTNSATLDVIVDPDFIGTNMDFVIEISNGSTYTVQMTESISGVNVSLPVSGLDAGTDYTFKVRYARSGTTNFSDYSNALSITTTETLEKPVIDDIRNITTDSVELVVETEGFDGDDADFEVRVTNKTTGDTYTIDFSETIGSDGTVILGIGGLDSGTEYEFEVRFKPDGEDDWSDYSDPETERTEYLDDEVYVTICSDGVTITVLEAEAQSYLDQGATRGPCPKVIDDKKTTICYENSTKTIPTSQLQKYLDMGATEGACTVSGGTTEIVEEIEEAQEGLMPSDEEKEELKKMIAPEGAKNTYETVAAVGAIAGTSVVLVGSVIPLFAAMPGAFSTTMFLNFIELFGIIGRRKEERNWGVVFESETRVPIPAVKIVLSDKAGKELATTYSDKEGRFGFLLEEGTYVINVFKKDYELVRNHDGKDELYGDVYSGGDVEVGEDHVMRTNIAMHAKNIDWQEFSEKRQSQFNSKFAVFVKYFSTMMFVLGLSATIIITYFYPSIFNFILLFIYAIILIHRIFFGKKKFGSVATYSGKPIPFAVVNLYDEDTNEKKKFAVTDSVGRYYLLADNGKYNLKAKGQPVSGEQFEKSGDVQVKDGTVRKDIIV